MPKLTAIVTAIILERPLCFRCLEEKSGATRAEVATVLRTIKSTLKVQIAERRCHACGEIVEAVSVDRPN